MSVVRNCEAVPRDGTRDELNNISKQKKPISEIGFLQRAEGEGFEPSIPLGGIPVFETGRFNHSRTLPRR
jgi:hypothetical protein